MFPFHPIAADAHGAAPSSVSVLISGVFTKTGVYGIIRVSYFLFRSMGLPAMQTGLVLIGCVSMFVCVTMALNQHDFKRLLAFHSISQIGYILTSLGLCTALGIVTCYLPYLLYTYGLTGLETGKASILASFEPVVATLVGIFVFHEKLTPLSALGCVCVLSAVVLLNLKRRQKANEIQ